MRKLILLVLVLVACDSAASPSRTPAQSATATFDPATAIPSTTGTIALEEVGNGFNNPTFLTNAGDGSGRIFVVEQPGTIRLLDGSLFLDIQDRVDDSANEQGLLGLAFAPDFATSKRFYVNYTGDDGATFITRFTTGADGLGDPASEEILLEIEQPAANHNGGMLAFGPDGYLYIGMGDGGGANDTYDNAQDRDSLLGKLLRIDVSGASGYTNLPDNPWSNGDGRPELWAYGLRNPWRFSFDRATGDLYIADVGQNQFEWIHLQRANSTGGQNYGWPIVEGFECLRGNDCDRTGLTAPILAYSHDEGGCTIVGGYVYRGTAMPQQQGSYFFADYCSGLLWKLIGGPTQWDKQLLLELPDNPSSFGEDEAGELYITALRNGTIYRLVER